MAAKINTLANVNVAAAGTRVQVSATKVNGIVSICFQGPPGNAGNVFVGDINVSATRGQTLKPGESYSIAAPMVNGRTEYLDLTQYYVDAATNADKVAVSYLTHV